MASKLVIRRQKQARLLQSSVEIYGARAAQALGDTLHPFLEPGQEPVDVGTLLRQLVEGILEARDKLVRADETNIIEQGEDLEPRRRRDALAKELAHRIGRLRATVENIFHRGATAEFLGIKGRTSQDPVRLHRQGQRIVATLSAPDVSWPAASFAGIAFTPSACAEALRPWVEALTQALRDITRARRNAEAALLKKNQALEHFDRTFLDSAQIIEGLFRMAGMEKVARRVRRPRPRRPSEIAAARHKKKAPLPIPRHGSDLMDALVSPI